MDLPKPPDQHPIRTKAARSGLRVGTAAGAGAAGAAIGSIVGDPFTGAVIGNSAGQGLQTVIELLTGRIARQEGTTDVSLERFHQHLDAYLTQGVHRMEALIDKAPDELDDHLTTYAALHKQIAANTQGVRQDVLMRGLAHFATSERVDTASFSQAMETVTALTRRQLALLAVLATPDPSDDMLISEMSPSPRQLDVLSRPDDRTFALVSRYKEIHDLMLTGRGLLWQRPQGMTGRLSNDEAHRHQPRDWSEIDPDQLNLTAFGHVVCDSLDLASIGIEIKHELLQELDPQGHEVAMKPRPYDHEREATPPRLRRLDESTQAQPATPDADGHTRS